MLSRTRTVNSSMKEYYGFGDVLASLRYSYNDGGDRTETEISLSFDEVAPGPITIKRNKNGFRLSALGEGEAGALLHSLEFLTSELRKGIDAASDPKNLTTLTVQSELVSRHDIVERYQDGG